MLKYIGLASKAVTAIKNNASYRRSPSSRWNLRRGITAIAHHPSSLTIRLDQTQTSHTLD